MAENTRLIFLLKAPKHIEDNKFMAINTLDGSIIDIRHSTDIERLERKKNCHIHRDVIKDGNCYKYSVVSLPDDKKCILNVLIGKFDGNSMSWKQSFTAEANLTKYDEKNHSYNVEYTESGDCDIEFWHEFFATRYLEKDYSEKNVNLYEEYDSMKELRKVFRMQLMPNPFLSFKRFKTLATKNKKYIQPEYDTKIFNIPPVKPNRNAGKANNSKVFSNPRGYYWEARKEKDTVEVNGKKYFPSSYAQQREIEIDGKVFLDVMWMNGPIIDGVMNEKESHRFFIGEDYWFSPDGGDIGVFSNYVCGNIFLTKMKKTSGLMLERYSGRYPYLYIMSKHYIPCFEILAKAGYYELADLMVDYWLKQEPDKNYESKKVNLFGKNDREIFGFRLSKFKNVDTRSYYNERINANESEFIEFIRAMQDIMKKSPSFFEENGHIEPELFAYAKRGIFDIDKNTVKYIRKQGAAMAEMYGDYLNMCRQSRWSSGGQFPTNLRASHDLMVSYMNQLKEAKNNQRFVETVESNEYKSLLYSGNEYCILAPRVANDLLVESRTLKHCVRSYIQNVAVGATRIYFLRKMSEKGKPLVTLEVNRMNICQARGACNRLVSKDEHEFILKWALEKGLGASFIY